MASCLLCVGRVRLGMHVQVTASSNFTADLGLDSLDAVEVVMAIEEEFSIEIPDEEVRSLRRRGVTWLGILTLSIDDAGRRYLYGRASH